jgi:alpha-ketoglutarate-dependent taurine dioxygenase
VVNSTVMLDVKPLSAVIGSVIAGVDLHEPLEPGTARAIREIVLERGVVFFRDQDLTREQTLAFMENFGTPCMDPISVIEQPFEPIETVIDMPTLGYQRATAVWHIDSSLGAEPASLIALRALEIPDAGGDTCWSNMQAVYESLSAPLRDMLDNLTALHTAYKVMPLMEGAGYPPVDDALRNVHPVVRVHPETGRKSLFVDELWTERILELDEEESDVLLAMLIKRIGSPLYTVRWNWQVHDLALWDNRFTEHYAVRDYEAHRVLQKSLLAGDRPFGPNA